MKIEIDQKDFGTLCICALRYCHGRETYMPSLVREIVGSQFKNISNNDIEIMLNDCDFQRKFNLYGDEIIDKPGWLKWEQILIEEKGRRKRCTE